jgi:hypothetical protein
LKIRTEDEDTGRATVAGRGVILEQDLNHGKSEGQGLSGTGSGASEDIVSVVDIVEGLGLDGEESVNATDTEGSDGGGRDSVGAQAQVLRDLVVGLLLCASLRGGIARSLGRGRSFDAGLLEARLDFLLRVRLGLARLLLLLFLLFLLFLLLFLLLLLLLLLDLL